MPPQRLHVWFRAIGHALHAHGLRALAGVVPFGEVLYDIASETLRRVQGLHGEREQLAALQDVAQASSDEVQVAAALVAVAVAGDQREPVRRALTAYLTQVQGAVRQALKRPSDPAGTTVPAGMRLTSVEHVIPLLPPRLAFFQPGARPAGVGGWELVELLGVGSCGEVWLARTPRLARSPVAVKFCLDPAAARALRQEAELFERVMQQGQHPGFVPLRQAYLDGDPPCLEYEYVPGCDLAGLVRDWKAPPAGPSLIERSRLVQQLAAILGHAHRLSPPLVHRNLKPANVLVQPVGGNGIELRVADFGVGGLTAGQVIEQARRGAITHGDQLAATLRGAHTPLYASPQQMRGVAPDPRDDVYALGVIWLQLLSGDLSSGRPAGKGWRRSLDEQGLAPELLELLESCLDEEPCTRPADAAVLSARLAELLTPPRVRASGPSPHQPGTSHRTPPGAGKPQSPTLVVARFGRADHHTITEALRVAPPHARILVKPGLYREALVLDRPVEIEADGPAGEVIIESTTADCILMQTDEAVVRGFTLRGRTGLANGKYYAVDVPQGRLLLENCEITSDSLACIAIHGVSADPTILKCKIHNSKDCGIHVYDKGRGTIEECAISNNTLSGVAIRLGGNPTFRRCTIHEGKVGGFLVYELGEGLIEDCDIVGNEYAGLEIKKGGNPVIRRCRIARSKQGSGVHCYEGGLGTVEECEVFGNTRAGVRIRESSNPTVRRCRIHDNEGGFYIQEQSRGTIEQCEITDNQRAGVDVMQGADATVRNCKITRNGYEAVWVHDSARATIENCDLTGNSRGPWDVAAGCEVLRSGNRE